MASTDPIFHGEEAGFDSVQWLAPREGLEIEAREISVSGDYQIDKLGAAGLDAEVFGDTVDPSFFIGIGIQAGIRSGISAEGNVNMVQRLSQTRPVRLGETLVVKGHIDMITEVPRGHTVSTVVSFEDAKGDVIVDASRTSLKPDPSRAGRRGAGDRPPPVVSEPGLASVMAEHQLTPDRVRGYSTEGNSIHYEEEAARKAGFRAPMIGGGMGVHYLAALLWSRGTPRQLDLSIYFRRPIFWDERFTAAVLGEPDDRASWRGLCLLRDEGDAGLKVLTEARIERLVDQPAESRSRRDSPDPHRQSSGPGGSISG